MPALWAPSNFRFVIDGVDESATGIWISKLTFSALDATNKGPSGTALQIPLDITRQVSDLEAHFQTVSGLSYEAEVVEHVAKIDEFCWKQSVITSTQPNWTGALLVETTLPGMLLFRFEPSRADTRYIRSRSGHMIILDDSCGVGGRIIAKSRGATLAMWRFDRGWFFALDPTRIAVGSPGNVLFVPEKLRRG